MKDMSIQSLTRELERLIEKCKRYATVIIFLLFALTYGFIVLRINVLSNAPVDQSGTATDSSPTLRIDTNAAKQLQTLKDNSTNVKALFETDRTNPFQE
jgi:hypothetical protein